MAGGIEHHDKIGIGAYQAFGGARLVEDVGLVDPAWFYNWRLDTPSVDLAGWSTGLDVWVAEGGGDGHGLRFGEGPAAWIQHFATMPGGRAYDLSAIAGDASAGRGGVSVDFLDAQGVRVGGGQIALAGAAATGATTIFAPAAARQARVVAWGVDAGFVLDAVRLTHDGVDALTNGDFAEALAVSRGDLRAAFVPMAWGADDVQAVSLGRMAPDAPLLGFNEPDSRGQANLSVEAAIALWPTLEAAGARLGSPAPTTPQTLASERWLPRFMARADEEGLRVDFIAVHYYVRNPDVRAFRSFLEQVHAT